MGSRSVFSFLALLHMRLTFQHQGSAVSIGQRPQHPFILSTYVNPNENRCAGITMHKAVFDLPGVLNVVQTFSGPQLSPIRTAPQISIRNHAVEMTKGRCYEWSRKVAQARSGVGCKHGLRLITTVDQSTPISFKAIWSPQEIDTVQEH